MPEYDNTGKAKTWWNRKGPKQPYTIICYAHKDIRAGEEFEVALWPTDGENPKAPKLTGVVQDKFVPKQQSGNMSRAEYMSRGGANEPQSVGKIVCESYEEFEDDIPF